MLDNKLSKEKFNEIMNGYKDIVSFDRFLNEGVYDPHIFKAFFLAGGPGSGPGAGGASGAARGPAFAGDVGDAIAAW